MYVIVVIVLQNSVWPIKYGVICVYDKLMEAGRQNLCKECKGYKCR